MVYGTISTSLAAYSTKKIEYQIRDIEHTSCFLL